MAQVIQFPVTRVNPPLPEHIAIMTLREVRDALEKGTL